MNEETKVLLITGLGGSGKTTLTQYIADKLGWHNLCEDDYWVKNNWSGLRTEEQEAYIQNHVIEDLLNAVNNGQKVVLEFILYKKPPNALTVYSKRLADNSVAFKTIAFKPSIDEIKKRLVKRGRANDLNNLDERVRYAQNQLRILDSDFIDPSWVIDPSNTPVNQLFVAHLAKLYAQQYSPNNICDA